MNYRFIRAQFIEDINSEVKIYEHIKTGARVACIKNEDKNKVFTIGFRTPVENSTGVPHIIEHSVLCGSKKYPVKDPFAEMTKRSLNTFLNAMTYPDKTIYPCASQNLSDFKNLMSVYLDAVLFPNIYTDKNIFLQEGWHYEILDKDDPIKYNGVVYNEMKGAFSNPQQVLYRTLFNAISPDTSYAFESGGDPEIIPTLSYEEFKNFHKRYYHPSNSYIFLYGDLDMEERMDWIDREYLSKFDKIDIDSKVKSQPAFSKMRNVTLEYPIGPNEDAGQRAQFAYALSLKDTKDVKLQLALNILASTLVNSTGAEIKQAIFDAKIAEDFQADLEVDIKQPIFAFIATNAKPDKKQEMLDIIKSKLTEALTNLNHEQVLSNINFYEFKAREGEFSYTPRGLGYITTMLGEWLYDEDPCLGLEKIKYYEELKEDLKKGYFEKVIENYLLRNNHAAFVELLPSKTILAEREKKTEEKLAKFKSSLSDKELDELIEMNVQLKKYQTEKNTKEEIDTLPTLTEEDIKEKPAEFKCEKVQNKDFDLYIEEGFTNDILYGTFAFNLGKNSVQDTKYINLLTDLYTKLPTKNYSVVELNSLLKRYLGKLNISFSRIRKVDDTFYNVVMIKFSTLKENLEKAKELIEEIIKNTKFDSYKEMLQSLVTAKANFQSYATSVGHRASFIRAGSFINEDYFFNDNVSGFGYYDFISEKIKEFESTKEKISEKLNNIAEIIFAKKRYFASCTCSKEDFEVFADCAKRVYDNLNGKGDFQEAEEFIPQKISEGIKTQSNVNYVSRVGDSKKVKSDFGGELNVINSLVGRTYFWNEIRVKGGAYGCFFKGSEEGDVLMSTYRDPHIIESDNVFKGTPKYLMELDIDDELLFNTKVGSLSGFNPPIHISNRGEIALVRTLKGKTYEDLCKSQEELINTSEESIREFGKVLKDLLENSALCVVGNSKQIEDNKDYFDKIREL